jgi:hypothetical protein
MRSHQVCSLAVSCLALFSLGAATATEPDSSRTAIDPATGQIRTIEHDDAAKLSNSSSNARSTSAYGAQARPKSPALERLRQAADGKVTTHANGTISIRNRLQDMDFLMATRQADGSITTHCVHGEDAAAHAAHVSATPSGGAHAQ